VLRWESGSLTRNAQPWIGPVDWLPLEACVGFSQQLIQTVKLGCIQMNQVGAFVKLWTVSSPLK